MSKENEAVTEVAAEEVKAEAIQSERQRIAEINAIAAKFNKQDMAASAVESGETVDAFRAKLVDELAKAPKQQKAEAKQEPTTTGRIEMTYRHNKKIKGFKSEADAFKAGQFLRAAIWKDGKAKQWLQDHYGEQFRAALGEGVGSTGGFVVPDEFSQAVIDLREQYGVMRNLVRVVPMARDVMYIPRRAGGLTAYWVGESTEITASDKSWDQVTLTARKMATLTRMSSEVAEDAIIDLASDVAGEVAYAFANAEDDAIVNGDGTSTYGGIYGFRPKLIDGNHTAGAIDAASGNDTFAEVTLTDLHNMMGALPAYARAGASFLVSQTGYSVMLERLKAAAGGNTIMDLEAGTRPNFMGYPVYISQVMPTSTGDLSNVAMILFGNFNLAATLGDRRGVEVVEDSSRYLEYDQIAIRGTCRMDCVVHDLGDTSTAGPVVGLIGE